MDKEAPSMPTKHAFYLILKNSPFPGTCEILPFHSELDAQKAMKCNNIKLKKSPAGISSPSLELWTLLSAEEALKQYPQAVSICNNMD